MSQSPQPPSRPGREPSNRWKLLLAVASVASTLALLELLVRLFAPLPPVGMSRFAPHPHLIYRGNPDHPDINSAGFGDTEHTVANPEGRFRIACIGGSTTFGRTNWPGRLEEVLNAGSDPPVVEVLNFGMAGYTSQESLINLAVTVQDYRPRVLVVHHALNDLMPRLYDEMQSDYGHFRKAYGGDGQGGLAGLASRSALFRWIQRRIGAEPSLASTTMRLEQHGRENPFRPESLHPDASVFERNLRTVVAVARAADMQPLLTTMPYSRDPTKLPRHWSISHAAKVQGMREHNAIIRELARELELPLVDLDAAMTGEEPFFRDHVHVHPSGRQRKAELIAGSSVFQEVRRR